MNYKYGFIMMALLRINHLSFWLSNILDNNAIICKKLATIVSGRKYVAWPFVRRKQETRVPKYNSNTLCCYISYTVIIGILVLTCFCLTKGHVTCFQPETIIASFLHIMVLFSKVLLNHSWKCQFVVFH